MNKLKQLEDLYVQQFNRAFPVHKVENFEESIGMNTQYIWNIYQIRYANLRESRNEMNSNYEKLLSAFEHYKEQTLNIFVVGNAEKMLIFFTNNKMDEILGVLNEYWEEGVMYQI